MKTHQGVTIFEMLLVLLIAAVIMVISIQQYLVYERQNQIDRVNANVDILFRAMQNFYQANCSANYNYAGEVTQGSGALDPSVVGASQNYPINIATQLIGVAPAVGFISQPIIQVPLVDASAGYLGYVAQFNLATSFTRTADDNTTPPVPRVIGTVYVLKAQIAVKIADAANIATYQKDLGADCISDAAGSGIVTPCESSPSANGTYLVWSRLPSWASPSSIPPTWPSAPLLRQFKEQYTHDTFYEMNNNGQVESPNGPVASNYLCGG